MAIQYLVLKRKIHLPVNAQIMVILSAQLVARLILGLVLYALYITISRK